MFALLSLTVAQFLNIAAAVAASGGFTSECPTQAARNVILVIGDGMGQAQIDAASLYRYGDTGELVMEQFPFRGLQRTGSANNPITDSAAAATAMATGRKVNNGVIALAKPGDETPIETILQRFQRCGRSTGLVATSVAYHATPAAFSAHVASRNQYEEIVTQQLWFTRPHILMGGGGRGFDPVGAAAAGYSVVTTAAELAAVDVSAPPTHLAGIFFEGQLPYQTEPQGDVPSLRAMTAVALNVLDRDPDGFFLLVEGSRIDHAGHDNQRDEIVLETLALDDTVEALVAWARDRDDTLVFITADHETGGMSITRDNGRGVFPDVAWTTSGHTDVDVPWFAMGRGASLIPAVVENTDIYSVLLGQHIGEAAQPE